MIGSIVNSILIKSILLQPTLFLIKWAVNIWSSLTTKNVYNSGLKKILSWLSLLRVNDRVKMASFFRETKGAKLIIIVHVNSFFVCIDSVKIINCDCKSLTMILKYQAIAISDCWVFIIRWIITTTTINIAWNSQLSWIIFMFAGT